MRDGGRVEEGGEEGKEGEGGYREGKEERISEREEKRQREGRLLICMICRIARSKWLACRCLLGRRRQARRVALRWSSPGERSS